MSDVEKIKKLRDLLDNGTQAPVAQNWMTRLRSSVRIGGLFNSVNTTIVILESDDDRAARCRRCTRPAP